MITKDLLSFLDDSTCCFTAVRNVVERLEGAGFNRLEMSEKWPVIHPGGKYYVIKNDSAVFVFNYFIYVYSSHCLFQSPL